MDGAEERYVDSVCGLLKESEERYVDSVCGLLKEYAIK